MKSLILEDYFDPKKETLTLEFKELAFKTNPSYYFTDEQIKQLLYFGNWPKKMSHVIMIEIKKVFEVLIGKYMSCFLNAGLKGTLVLGVDDNGFIKGIPSKIPLTQSIVSGMIKTTIEKYVKMERNIDDFISNNIKVEVKKLEIISALVDNNIDDTLESFKKNELQYKLEIKNYVTERKIWSDKLFNCRSLDLAVNSMEHRPGFLKYVKENAESHVFQKINKIFDNNDKINIPSGTELFQYKKNKDSVYYWIMEYKDDLIKSILKEKPKKPINKNKCDESILLTKISNLNSKFIKDPEIKFYLIFVEIDGIDNTDTIYYKLPGSDEWLYRSRAIVNGQPGCICF